MIKRLTSLLFAISLSSCAGTYSYELDFNPTHPIRIAVLPFAQVDSSGALVQADENYLIDNVALVSSKLKETPAQFVQNLVQSELSDVSLDLLAPAVVEAALLHKGYEVPNTQPVKVNLEKLFKTSPQTICKEILSCDAVLFGKVTKWSRSYYGVQAVASIGVELTILSAKDGKILFTAKSRDSDSRGLTKGPTGFSDIVLEPLRGLDNGIITNLAHELVRKTLLPLHLETRPEYLQTAPPAILAAAHDARSGVLNRKSRLTVVALGSPKQMASFSIGKEIIDVPMIERMPGHYIGEYVPLSTDQFSSQKVTVSLKDTFGRVTHQPLGRSEVSLQ